MATPGVSIIILNYNGSEYTNPCLRSLEEISYDDYEVIVVDNGSDQEDPEEAIDPIPEMQLYETGENLGFSKGCNYGAERASGRFLLFLNNDTTVTESLFDRLLVPLRDGSAAAAVPQVRFDHNREVIDKGYGMYDALGFGWHPNHLKRADAETVPDESIETPWGSGCAFAVTRDAFDEVGGFDPDYFLYTDDLDLSIRLRKAGYSIKYVPDAVLYHKYSRGVKDELDLDRSSFQVFHEQRNRAKFLLKLFPAVTLIRNLPHILASFIYWNLFIARKESISRVVDGIRDQVRFALKGLSERNTQNAGRWTKYMKQHTIFDYARLAMNREEYYEGEFEIPDMTDPTED